ncbi:MAG: hypothetical protein R3F11_15555 [Verrucomicrobiales bacterium]
MGETLRRLKALRTQFYPLVRFDRGGQLRPAIGALELEHVEVNGDFLGGMLFAERADRLLGLVGVQLLGMSLTDPRRRARCRACRGSR